MTPRLDDGAIDFGRFTGTSTMAKINIFGTNTRLPDAFAPAGEAQGSEPRAPADHKREINARELKTRNGTPIRVFNGAPQESRSLRESDPGRSR